MANNHNIFARLQYQSPCADEWPIHGIYHLGWNGVIVKNGIAEVPLNDDVAITHLLFRNFIYADPSFVIRDEEGREVQAASHSVNQNEGFPDQYASIVNASKNATDDVKSAQVVADVEKAIADAKAAQLELPVEELPAQATSETEVTDKDASSEEPKTPAPPTSRKRK